MSQFPFISVVIPAYNEEDYLGNCIYSIKRQKIDFPYEIIVVDNNSKDKTADIAQKNNVRLVNEKKQGICFARQAGLDSAKGEIVIYIDADTRLSDGWLEKVVEYFQKHPKVVGISSNFYFYDGTLIDNLALFIFRKIIAPLANLVLRFFRRPDIVIGLALVVRTDILRKAGGVNKDFVFYGEETGIADKLNKFGKVRYLRKLHVYTSARRYQKRGRVKTVMLYWLTFILMELGRYGLAKKISLKYSPSARIAYTENRV